LGVVFKTIPEDNDEVLLMYFGFYNNALLLLLVCCEVVRDILGIGENR
jgi:hypothetical protein